MELEGISAPSQRQKPFNRATRIGVSAVGVLCGLAGIEHGVGEILQGNVAASGFVINAWEPSSPLFGEEPALTLVPNVLVTGVLAVIVSLLVILWSVGFVQKKNGALGLILLAITQFLVGGGIAPLFPAITVGIAATRINAPLTWWRIHLLLTQGGYSQNCGCFHLSPSRFCIHLFFSAGLSMVRTWSLP